VASSGACDGVRGGPQISGRAGIVPLDAIGDALSRTSHPALCLRDVRQIGQPSDLRWQLIEAPQRIAAVACPIHCLDFTQRPRGCESLGRQWPNGDDLPVTECAGGHLLGLMAPQTLQRSGDIRVAVSAATTARTAHFKLQIVTTHLYAITGEFHATLNNCNTINRLHRAPQTRCRPN